MTGRVCVAAFKKFRILAMKHLWFVVCFFSSGVFANTIELTATEFGQVDQIKLGMKFDEVEKIYGARAQWKQGANEPYLVVNLSKTCHVRLGSKEFGMVVRIAIPQACIQTFDGLTHGLSYNEIFKDKEPSWQDTPGEFPQDLILDSHNFRIKPGQPQIKKWLAGLRK
jgi:hypothetical protein